MIADSLGHPPFFVYLLLLKRPWCYWFSRKTTTLTFAGSMQRKSPLQLWYSLTHSPSLLPVRHKLSPCVILWYSITNYLFLQYELRLWHQSICHPFNCGNHSLTHSSSSSSLKHKASPHVILWYSSTNLFLWPQTITSIISYIVIHPGFVTMTLFLLNLVNWTSQFPNSSTPLTPDKDNRDNRRRGHCLTGEGAIEFSNLPT